MRAEDAAEAKADARLHPQTLGAGSARASLLNPDWKYVPAEYSNILDRFRAMDWVPPSEVKDGRKGERLPS